MTLLFESKNMSIPLQRNPNGVGLPIKGSESLFADSSVGAGQPCVSSSESERSSGKLLLREVWVDKSTEGHNKTLDQFQVEPSTGLKVQEVKTGHVPHPFTSVTPLPRALNETSATTRASQTASAYSIQLFKHQNCSWSEHSDDCWNSPLWAASNMTHKARLEERILAGCFEPGSSGQEVTPDGKYQFSYRLYHDKNRRSYGYSNNKVTRCADGKVLMDINRNFAKPSCHYFKCRGDQWVLSGHSYMSPVLVNLTTEKTYEQRGDQYCPFEMTWKEVEASPDGNTLLATVLPMYGSPKEYRFYDFSHPDQGFRRLPTQLCLFTPGNGSVRASKWCVDRDNKTTITLYAEKSIIDMDSDSDSSSSSDCDDDPVLYQYTLRREGARMVIVSEERAYPDSTHGVYFRS